MAAADTNAILAGANALAGQPSPVAQFGQFANALGAGLQLRQDGKSQGRSPGTASSRKAWRLGREGGT